MKKSKILDATPRGVFYDKISPSGRNDRIISYLFICVFHDCRKAGAFAKPTLPDSDHPVHGRPGAVTDILRHIDDIPVQFQSVQGLFERYFLHMRTANTAQA